MFRSRRRAGREALLVAALTGAAVAGQVATAASQPAATAEVRDLTLPVLDLRLETSSLDGSVRRVEGEDDLRLTLAADVLFEFNRAELTGRAQQRIEQVADELRRAGPGTVMIEGHTDSRGSAAYNRALSRRRAAAVRTVLSRSLGGSAPRFVTVGKGESRPVAANTKPDGSDSPRGRARNRRVEVRIPKG